MRIISTSRSDLIKIARASSAPMTPVMERFIDRLIEDGQYAVATQDEIEFFDEIFDEMEEQS